MSTASVLIAADHTAPSTDTPRYSLLLTTDPELVAAAQRLRYDVFTSEPGFALPAASDGRDADRFDEHCDHLLVREDTTGELVGCYRMLPPAGAIEADGSSEGTVRTRVRNSSTSRATRSACTAAFNRSSSSGSSSTG